MVVVDLYDVMRTTPAVREFTDDPLPDDVLHRILDHARFAPSGGNRQGAHVVVVRDQGTRERLAALYDVLDTDRGDLVPYLLMAGEFGARSVLDLGCGTGVFALLLAERGIEVVGADPAQASVDVARAKPGGDQVRWICGDAAALPLLQVDLATMTANVQDLVDLRLRQRVMRDVSERRQATTVLGQELTMPVILGPVGLGGMFAARAEVQAATAAAAAGVPFVESTVSICSIVVRIASSPVMVPLI